MKTPQFPLKRKGHRVIIDVLAVHAAIHRRDLSASDRQTIERMMPGLCARIEAQLEKKANDKK
jgi:hypothetical protein